MRLLGIVMASVVLTACGGSGAKPLTASQIASKMHLANAKVMRVTGANDPNKLLGRSGGYTSKVAISVPGKPCTSVKQECGVEVEVFSSADAAKQRAKYIQAITQSAAIFGSEYDTRSGGALLRVHGDLSPAQAKKYQTAFRSATG